MKLRNFLKYKIILIPLIFITSIVLIKLIIFIINNPNAERILNNQTKKDIVERKNYLISKLDEGKFSVNGMPPVGKLFQAEWALVTASMTASALTNIAFRYPDTRKDAIKEIEKIIKVVLSEDLREIGYLTWVKDPLDNLMFSKPQIWYLAHLGMVLSSYRYCGGDERYDSLNVIVNSSMINALNKSKIPYLETYPEEIYSADNTVMYASIKLYDGLFGENNDSLVQRWINYSMKEMSDPKTGIIKSYIIENDGPSFNSRGSWAGWMSFYLPLINTDFARDQYEKTKKYFFTRLFGFKVCREYPKGVNAAGDVDSGPVIFGASPSGTGFITGGAVYQNDTESINGFLTTAEFIGTSVSFGGKKHYLLSPLVGDAIMLAMKTAIVWDKRYLKDHGRYLNPANTF